MKKLVLALVAAASLVPAAAMAQEQPARVGGQTKAPTRITYVPPVYPEAAKTAGVSGVVIFEATISADGDVTEAHILRSIAPLDMAAIDAVKQWKYTPTTLNGRPVPVIATVTVNFSLAAQPAAAMQGADEVRTALSDAVKSGQNVTIANAQPEPVLLNGREVLRVGGEVKAPERVRYVAPIYPQAAQDARVMGIVIIEAVVDESGHVANAKVLRSISMLDQAAMDAVLQWEYTPTSLNGVPVPVLMTETVNFTLQ